MPLSRQIDLVSVSATGQLGDYQTGERTLAINRDGSLIGFYSNSDTLYSPNPGGADYVIKNLNTGAIQAITIGVDGGQSNGRSGGAQDAYNELAISADGHFQAFGSTALLTSTQDTTGEDIFWHSGNSLVMASATQGGSKPYHCSTPDISDNGRYIVFQSMDNLLAPKDSNGSGDTDIYWYDQNTGVLQMVSGSANGSVQGANNGGEADSSNASVSNDGRFVLFQSTASNLVNGDTNNYQDIFLRDMVTTECYLLSTSSTGQLANSGSFDAAMTPDAHYVVFTSNATNLVANDADGTGYDVYRLNLGTGEKVQVNTTTAGVAVGGAFHPQISADGRYVVFESTATDLVPVAGDSNAITKIFVKDLNTGSIAIASLDSNGAVNHQSAYAPQISDDGQFIAFTTADGLLSSDSNGKTDVYRVTNPVYGSGSDLSNDVFTDSPGSETFAGGSGLDMVVYSGDRASYTLAPTAGGFSIAGDSLSSIERLQFWDTNIALDLTPAGNAGKALEFIGMLAFNAVTDKAVVGEIISYFDQLPSMYDICQIAVNAGLTSALAGNDSSNAALARLVFRNVAGQEASAGDVDSLVSYMDGRNASMSQADFLTAISDLQLNQNHVNLVGLQTTGLEYTQYIG